VDSLVERARDLRGRGAPLIVRVGDAAEVLATIAAETNAIEVHAHQEHGTLATFARDRRVAAALRARGVRFVEHRQTGAIRGLATRDGWAARWAEFMAEPVTAVPDRLTTMPGLSSDPVPTADSLGMRPGSCEDPQRGGRARGLALLSSFLAGRGAAYHREMSSPLSAFDACSRLSPHLTWGTLSMREVVQTTLQARSERRLDARPLDAFLGRLHWHCHFIQKLEDMPDLERRCFHPFAEDLDRHGAGHPHLAAWAEGHTGFPFLDACLRALNHTGWINFRMRAMIVAIASYHLALDWRASGPVLARSFTDYEPGIHWSQMQMQSGTTGINTPRIYNPVKQSFDQDPDGRFIRRFVPELSHVPTPFLHEPWRMTRLEQEAHGVVLERDYPMRIIDHEAAARRAKAEITAMRSRSGYWDLAERVIAQHASRKRPARGPDGPWERKGRTTTPSPPASPQLSFDL
jgi:deoxyribodipyrimidine photo-lyase